MFVIHSTKKGFVHIPRTAGRFIESQCSSLDSFESIKPYHQLIPVDLSTYEWHTRLRNPVERFISIYRHNKTSTMSKHSGTIDTFIDLVSKEFEWHTRPQVEFLSKNIKCWTDISKCIQALGSTITGSSINQSIAEKPVLNDDQKKRIIQIYREDVELFLKINSSIDVVSKDCDYILKALEGLE